MKNLIFIVALFTIVSCGSGAEDINPNDPVTESTEEELNEVQEDNITLEQIDGELDSVLNEIE